MDSNAYHFISHWRVPGTIREVSDILGNAPDLVRWWPSVYLDVRVVEAGGADGVGAVVSLFTKGWLPYTLRWQFRVTEVNDPYGFALEAWGDFVGRGVWIFRQDGADVEIIYDWAVKAEMALLRHLSWLFKPIFAANHHWAMQKGYESLFLELARQHATTDEARTQIPAPPQPTFARWLRSPATAASA